MHRRNMLCSYVTSQPIALTTVAQIISGQIYSAAHLQETQMGAN